MITKRNIKLSTENMRSMDVKKTADSELDLDTNMEAEEVFDELEAGAEPAETSDTGRGRKLTSKNSTFTLEEGDYQGIITQAFWFKTNADKDRVMLIFELRDGTEFKTSVDGDWIEDYPFSKLISQANVEYVEDFVGLNVRFEIRNHEGDEVVFSNIRKIALDE